MATMTSAVSGGNIRRRIESYRVSKTLVVLSCIVCTTAVVTLGFTQGDWMTSGAAAAMADRAALGGQAKLAAAICADRFITGPHATIQTAVLEEASNAQRSEFLAQGGWLTLPGMTDPIPGAAELCAQQILNSTASFD